MGRLAEVGVAYDPETGKPTEKVSVVNAERYVAILAHRHRDEFVAEIRRYAQDQATAARAEWQAQYGNDIEKTEAGSRG